MRIKPISISLSPNTEQDDILLAFKLLFQPWLWKKGASILALEQEFAKYLGVKYAFSFNSGRSALMAILSALKGDPASAEATAGKEVLLQAFTCNAVPNPVLWAGLKPVYVDCREDDFNIDPVDLERKITSRSKLVIVQHTFGLPADMDRIMEICNRRNLIVIEDCAHALGTKYKGRLAGTFGRASFFSFSRDKVISSVYGGMVATNDPILAQNIQTFQQEIGYPSLFWTFQQLLHPVIMNWKILPTYRIWGKFSLVIYQQMHILSKAVHWKEKRGKMPGYFPRRLPNALAILALHQFEKLERFNMHRRQIAAMYAKELSSTSYQSKLGMGQAKYDQGSIFLRFPVRHEKAHEIIRKAWSKNLLIGDWYTSPVAPHDTKLDTVGYTIGSCPVAEKLAKITFNLPTHIRISKKDAEDIITFLKSMAM